MSSIREQIRGHIRAVPDFPVPGVLFRDISPIFLQPQLITASVRALADHWLDKDITKVIGIDSRGFLLGPQMAEQLEAGFVMVRKKGKLPPETISVSYSLEYGEAVLESIKAAIQPGDRVVIHDDLLATGGTAAAAAQLVQKLGGEVAGFSFIVILNYLSGRRAIEAYSSDIHGLVGFDE
jgi:adenine phosphoribosyltransferase